MKVKKFIYKYSEASTLFGIKAIDKNTDPQIQSPPQTLSEETAAYPHICMPQRTPRFEINMNAV